MDFETVLQLQNGLSVYVDKADYTNLNNYNWYMRKSYGKSGKLKRVGILTSVKNENNKHTERPLSHFLFDLEKDEMVIHLNGNKLDYRRSNLKVIKQKEHNFYRKSVNGSSSKYKGVTKESRTDSWVAQTKIDGVKHYLGTFKSEESAAKAYNDFIIETFGTDKGYYLNVIGEDNRNLELNVFEGESNVESKRYLKRNQKRYSTKNNSAFRGVSVNVSSSGVLYYNVAIRKDNVRFPLGTYKDEKEAAKVYNEAFLVLYGEDYTEDELQKYLNDIAE